MMNANLRTIKNEVIPPFALSSSNIWQKIEYRYDTAESWRNGLDRPFVVLPSTLQDIRHDAQHSFRIDVDLAALGADRINSAEVELVVLCRDNFSKKVITLYRQPLSTASEIIIDVDRHALEATSLNRRIDFEIMLVARNLISIAGKAVRPSARLAKHVISVSTESEGLSFNFRRTTAEEFTSFNLPGSTTFHIDLKNSSDLLTSCDDVSSVLRVLVHEDAWTTLQEIKGGNALGEALGTMFGSDLLFTIVSAIAQDETKEIEDGSIAHRIISWIAFSTNSDMQGYKDLLSEPGEAGHLQAHIQNALKMTRAIKRVRLEQGETE